MDWAAIIEQQEVSGMGVREFCLQRGIKESKFYMRRARLRNVKAVAGKFVCVETGERTISLKLSETLTLQVKPEDLGQVLKELIACAR